MKRCSSCQQVKAPSDFYPNSRMKSGLSTYCRPCHKRRAQEWHKTNPERWAEIRKRTRQKNKATINARAKEWRANHRELLAERQKGYRLRFRVLMRDNFTCRYCGRKAEDSQLEVDHIIPRALGGSNSMSNLTTACWDCNRGKGALLLTKNNPPCA